MQGQELHRTSDQSNTIAFLGFQYPQRPIHLTTTEDTEEIQVLGRCKGKPLFEKQFPLKKQQDLATVLQAVRAFIEEQTR